MFAFVGGVLNSLWFAGWFECWWFVDGSFVVCVFWCEWIGVYDYGCVCLMLLLCLWVGL